jgi:D-glycero-alpha-D-manno-heptose-7-phosphate kinase
MIQQSRYLGDILKEREIIASAPCRLDISGTWDLKAFALLYEHIPPTTTNMALSPRTYVCLKPFKDKWIRISDDTASEEYRIDDIHFDTRFRLLFAIAAHFNVHGFEIQLSYEAPPRSGLGGSGVLAITAIAAINKACEAFGEPEFSKPYIIELAHNIEDGLRYSYTGMQDQCAAAYGGVNKWYWTYASPESKFKRIELLPPSSFPALDSRLVVAYIGRSHTSDDVNSQQVAWFLNGRTRSPWFRINEIANEFAEALLVSDWEKAGALISEETAIRCELVPSRITPIGEKLMKIAHTLKAGFSTAGAGNGGCVWALCREPKDAVDLKSYWSEVLGKVETAKILAVKIDSKGLIVSK